MNTRQIIGISVVIILINVYIIYSTTKNNKRSRFYNVVDEYVKNMQQWIKSKENASAKRWYEGIVSKGAKREQMLNTDDINVVYATKYQRTDDFGYTQDIINEQEYNKLKDDPYWKNRIKQVPDKTKPLDLKNIEYYIADDVTYGLKTYNNLKAFNIEVPLSVINDYRKTLNLPQI